MPKVGGVVILYNPDEDAVIRNIQSYINFLGSLIVFSNSKCNPAFIETIKKISSKIIFIPNAENEGIAKPLNKALKLTEGKFKWLLTMDQDSYFEETQAQQYFKQFEERFYNSTSIAIVCPNHSDKDNYTKDITATKEVTASITSGSLINLSICKELNGFDEKLFIDEVDMEYSYRCILAGYKVVQFYNIRLKHELGTRVEAGYFNLFKKSNRSVHSPFRIYFIVRNYLYVSSKYSKQLPEEFKLRKKGFYVILKNNLLFSDKFFKVLIAIIKGYLHFKINNFSNKVNS